MKIQHKVALILFFLVSYNIVNPSRVLAQRGDINFQVFYDQLSPYGEWTRNSDYGYIWIPDIGPEFSPYSTNGYWVMTDYGWTWVSDYPWGWAAFHYGRWDYDNYYGWFWVPDNEWGPSWVTWRRGNGYYGWAPMRPGISVSMSFGNGYNDADRWNFIRDRDFGRSNMGRYYVNRSDNDRIFRSSSVINNTYNDNERNVTYIAGPRGEDVQRYSGRRVTRVTIHDNDQPGQKLTRNELQIYRPQVDRNNDVRQRSAPSRVSEMKEIRPPSERNVGNKRNNLPVQQQQQQQPPAENRRQEQINQAQQKQKDQQSKQQQQVQQQQIQQQQDESRRNDQQKQKDQQSQQQQVQQQQVKQQQDESRRNDQQKQKDQQQQQQQQQQAETRRQDLQQQQQKQTLQQNTKKKQEVSGTAKSKRLERQQNKANSAVKKEKKEENPKQENK